MRSFWRLLLLCLMAVALPVQGYAAAGAVHCATMHERMHAAMGAEHSHDEAAAPHHHEAAADEHEADNVGPAGFKCSACAACCVAIGLPASAPPLPTLPVASAARLPSSAALATFLTGGPERPPRSLLA